MEADIEPIPERNREQFIDADIRLADRLTKKSLEMYKDLIASSMLIRSEKNTVMFLVDDFNQMIVQDKLNEMKVKITEMSYENQIDIPFTFMLVSDFWKHIQARSDQLMDILRYSYVLHDIGFARPMHELFATGKIRPSKESTKVYFVRAEKGLKNSHRHLVTAVIDIYWAVLDTAHAGVMLAGITPPSPEHLAEIVKKELVGRKLIHKRCAEIIENIYKIAKEFIHNKRWEITGREFDKYVEDAEFFIKEMTEFVKKHQDRQGGGA